MPGCETSILRHDASGLDYPRLPSTTLGLVVSPSKDDAEVFGQVWVFEDFVVVSGLLGFSPVAFESPVLLLVVKEMQGWYWQWFQEESLLESC